MSLGYIHNGHEAPQIAGRFFRPVEFREGDR